MLYVLTYADVCALLGVARRLDTRSDPSVGEREGDLAFALEQARLNRASIES
jgi:hypothetical protein